MLTIIRCKSAQAATYLASVLTTEGSPAVWYRGTNGPEVATCAVPALVMDCVSLVESALSIPASKRTRTRDITIG